MGSCTSTFWYHLDVDHCRFSVNVNRAGWREAGVPPGHHSDNRFLIDLLNQGGQEKRKVGANAMKREAAGAHLPTFEGSAQ